MLLIKKLSELWMPAMVSVGLTIVLPTPWSLQAIAQTAPAKAIQLAQAAPTNATVLVVNPTAGNDTTGDGSERAPLKTITQALQIAQPNTIILLAPGTYSADTGERFPLQLRSGVTVQGDVPSRGQGIVIQGSGQFLSPTFARQNITILGADQARLVGVTISNPHPQGYGVWVESSSPVLTDNTFTGSGHDGISVTGNSAPLIRNNYFFQNGANGITIYGTSRAEVRENIFEQTGFAININQQAAPLIVGNRITQNKDGVVVQAKAQPILRNNSVEGNQRDGLVAIAEARPNLGTASEPGGNLFRNNGQFDINAKSSSQTIPAFGNEVSKTVGQLDLTGTTQASAPAPAVPTAAQPTPDVPRSPAPVVSTAPAPSPATSVPVTVVVPPVSAPPTIAAPRSRPPVIASPPASAPQRSGDDISADSFPVPANVQATPPQRRPELPPRLALETRQPNPVPVPVPAPVQPLPTVDLTASAPRSSSSEPNSAATTPVSSARSLPRLPVPAATNSGRSTRADISRADISRADTARADIARAVISRQSFASSSRSGFKVPTPDNPIPIAVPEPESGSAAASVDSATPAPVRSVAIAVPQPVSESGQSFGSTKSVLPRTIAAAPVKAGQLDLLPVPGPDAPLGNIGERPGIPVYRNSRQREASRAVTIANRASLSSLRYRVVVDAADDSQQAQVRSVVPNAFRTYLKGRMVLQVGAFGDRSKADELAQTLASQGISAKVEQVE